LQPERDAVVRLVEPARIDLTQTFSQRTPQERIRLPHLGTARPDRL
jgi:hypothetical protein